MCWRIRCADLPRPELRDPRSWIGCTPDQISDMLHSAPLEDVTAVLGSPAADWIVEPGRLPGAIRLRNVPDPSYQMVLMPGGTTLRDGPLGHSSLEIERQRLLLAAAERASLWDLHLGTTEETVALIEWGLETEWVGLAVEVGRSGRRSAEWTELPREQSSNELRDRRNWSAGPYPSEGTFAELFILLTPEGTKVVGAGAADDAINEAFAKRRTA